MDLFSGLQCIKIRKAATGTVALPANWNGGTAYDVLCLEGVGTHTVDTKTATGFDVVQTGACVWGVFPHKPNNLTSPS